MANAESERVKLIDFGGAQFYTKGRVIDELWKQSETKSNLDTIWQNGTTKLPLKQASNN